MIEANPTKFYVAKYFFLVFACIQWIVGGTLLINQPFGARNFFTSLIFLTFGLIFLYLYAIISDKIRRVAVGKNKIIIIEGQRNVRFNWPEVKSLKIIPYLNLYRLKIRGKKGSIYFFPSTNIDPAFGLIAKDTSKMGDIVAKRKKEFGIK
ncbi:hypothetical protein [Pseudochryseolinea flava]|uniref:Uncharacterized protein n=1 Tax=Pseudochryseolinea flava TaxID=2059302 RepID=A0A364XZH7_9BACT|nr:hypothetical protein [Pseudochryseolinea flava]RAV99778.1 hypothetical protein DQQ10_17180 [Pseudochryseolinea flava]